MTCLLIIIFSILSIVFFPLSALPPRETDNPLPSERRATPQQALPGFGSCLIIGQPNRNAYSFFNACNDQLYINVCTTDITGETKLYTSGRTIPIGGRYTIFTFYEVRPGNVAWSADPILAQVPPPCKVQKT